MKSLLLSIVSLLVANTAFAARTKSSCHEQAKIGAQERIKTLATEALNAEGQSLLTLEVENEPFFIFHGDNPEGFLGNGDSAFTVFASIDEAQALERGLPTKFIVGFLFTRCSLENPSLVKTIWFQRDAEATEQ